MPQQLLHGWFLNAAVIGACATMLAQAAGQAFVPIEPVTPARPVRARPVAAQPSVDVAEIVTRNIFCSRCDGLEPEVPVPPPERLPLQLLAILYAPPPSDPSRSLAVVRDTEDRSLHAVVIGDQLRDATVVEMGPARIQLREGFHLHTLALLAQPAQPPAPAPVVASPSDPLATELARGVRQLAEGSYEIDRATLNAVLANTSALQGARVTPELRDGHAAGFRLSGVRAGGPFARIGLRNGDVVVSINGLALTQAESALDAFVKLRSASHLSLGLEREGRRMTHEYRIR